MRMVSQGTVSSKSNKCDKCGRTFSRREHLLRHRRGCETQGRGRSFTCHICGNGFTRKDVMDRHIKSLHDMYGSGKSTKRSSCLQCVNLKIRCSGGPPICKACRDRRANCQFEEEESTLSGTIPLPVRIQPKFIPSEGRINESPKIQIFNGAEKATLDGHLSNTSRAYDMLTRFASMQGSSEQHDADQSFYRQHHEESLLDNFLSDTNVVNGDMFSDGWLCSAVSEAAALQPCRDTAPPMGSFDIPFPIAEPVRCKSSWNLFWLPEEESAIKSTALPELTLNVQLPATQIPISEWTRTNIIKLLSASMATGTHQDTYLRTLPSKDVLGHCIALYFKHFDPILPIFHFPTFDPDKTTEVLLIVMIGIGSAYSTAEGAQNFANIVVELAVHTLTWMGDLDPRYRKTLFYIVTLLLVSYYTVGAGDKHLLGESESLRSHLIVNARYMGLFDPQTWIDADDLQACWHKWRDEELRKRVAWNIFALDSSVSIFSSVRPCISLIDLKVNFPCEDRLWTAPTAHAWAGIFPWTGRSPRGLPFLRTFGDFVSGKVAASALPCYTRRICSQVLQRLFREMKELEISTMSKILKLPLENQFSSGGAIMKAMTALLESVNETPHNFADYVNHASIIAITHYTCLWAPRGVLDQLMSLLRTERHDRGPILVSLGKEFTSRPVDARRLAWHAAQIITLFRHRPIKSPIEGIRIFMSGYYLYMFSRYFSDDGSSSTSTYKLDNCSWIEKTVPHEWISYGGKSTFANIVLSRQNCKAVLNLMLECLCGLPVWGISQQFYFILEQVAEDINESAFTM